MKQISLTILPIILLVTSTALFAVGEPVPNIFSNGQPADADQVNANFQELSDRIQAVSTQDVVTYDYRDYMHNFASKTFVKKRRSSFVENNEYLLTIAGREKRTYTSITANELVVTVNTILLDGSTGPRTDIYKYLRSDNDIALVNYTFIDNYDPIVPNTRTTTGDYTPALVKRTSTMGVGHTWGNASFVAENVTDTDPTKIDEIWESWKIEPRTLLGVEAEVIVLGVTYSNCLRILRNLSYSPISRNSRAVIYWYCEGVGLVRRVGDSGGTVLELESTEAKAQ